MEPKKKVGRPSKYDPMFCEMIIDYFLKAKDAPARDLEPVTTTQTDAKGGFQKSEVRKICAELPTLEGFGITIDTPRKTMLEWCEKHEDFGNAYARAKDIQYSILVDRGMTRQYDPTAFQFVAKNVTWMKDRHELTGADGGAMNVVVMQCDADTKGRD